MNAFEWVMLTKSGRWGLAVAITLGMLAGAVVAQDEVTEHGAVDMPQEVMVKKEAPVVMIPVFQVNTRQMAAPRYIRLDGNVDCNPTNDGGMFCFATPPAMPERGEAE